MSRSLSMVGFLFAATVAAQQQSSGGELIAEQACYDVLHYTLELRVDPGKRSIHGALTMRARATAKIGRLVLDLDEHLEVAGVEVSQGRARFSHKGHRIRIKPGKTIGDGELFEVRVRYGGQPRVAPNPPWQGGFTWSRTPKGKQPWIATSCQGQGADLWWPCKDHPSDKPDTMDLFITVPDGLVCASNGTLQSDEIESEGWRQFHWQVANPISNYCVALNIAPYVVLEQSYESVTGEVFPVLFWVLPEHEKQGRKVLPEFIGQLRQMEQHCGPYPFRNEKYGVAETPHLGMEHQTIIAYGYKFQKQAPGYDWLHHHEMSHEWWANLVTCRDWKDMWIHEGIGTYMQVLYIEQRFGVEAMRQEIRSKQRSSMNRRAVAPREVQDTNQIYFSMSGNDIYAKGAAIMHSLRWLLGDEKFFVALRRMAYPDPAKEQVTDGTQTRLTDTDEIRGIAEAQFGDSLLWFFDVYLHQPKLPELVVKTRGKTLLLRWRAPDKIVFPMPVPVQIGEAIHRVEMPGGKAEIKVSGSDWEIDPHAWLLREMRPRRRR